MSLLNIDVVRPVSPSSETTVPRKEKRRKLDREGPSKYPPIPIEDQDDTKTPSPLAYSTVPYRSTWKEDNLFPIAMNPRKLLRPDQLEGIRDLFPAAVGVRLLATGHRVVLMSSLSDIKKTFETNWVMQIGSLRVIYDVIREPCLLWSGAYTLTRQYLRC
ncbi:hypothetical protein BDV29DRAFT_156127 [Aspergillus leporis]|jgi:hypothetical protein|uniref:Uncharacterized protein n=1 Tax=Aspergillus leporis TaxID=41062 RepID=A0A5N5X4H4_9EURO|nr:hypothetical protein BDV29DRAFT_156127 [Aspergillus leporis]